jgi:AcrR family transcriptional regulator
MGTIMAPRKYAMETRSAAASATRRRIVEATVALHGQKGIFGTSWQDIAHASDVSVGTVYKHFPTLDQLVPACGELLMQRLRPPTIDDVGRLIGDAEAPAERLRRAATVLFDFYERGGDHLENDRREREISAIRDWENELQDMVTGFVRQALSGLDLEDEAIQAVSALLDFATFRALRRRGISVESAVAYAVSMAAGAASPHARAMFAEGRDNEQGGEDDGSAGEKQ